MTAKWFIADSEEPNPHFNQIFHTVTSGLRVEHTMTSHASLEEQMSRNNDQTVLI